MDENRAKMKKLHEDKWSCSRILQKDSFYAENNSASECDVEIDDGEIFMNYVTLMIPMIDNVEFVELALGKGAAKDQPAAKGNIVRVRQLTTTLAKANNLKQGKGISVQCT